MILKWHTGHPSNCESISSSKRFAYVKKLLSSSSDLECIPAFSRFLVSDVGNTQDVCGFTRLLGQVIQQIPITFESFQQLVWKMTSFPFAEEVVPIMKAIEDGKHAKIKTECEKFLKLKKVTWQ